MKIIKQLNKNLKKDLFKIDETLFFQLIESKKSSDGIHIKCEVYERDFSEEPLCKMNIQIPYKFIEEKYSVYENYPSKNSTRILAFNELLIENMESMLPVKTIYEINHKVINVIQNNIKEIINNEHSNRDKSEFGRRDSI